MIDRFLRIRDEFGVGALLRTCLLLVGLLAMMAINYFALGSFTASIVVLVGLLLGVVLRNVIPVGVESYAKIIRIGLIIYPIVLFLGERFGLDGSAKLSIIAAVTVVIFDLQFWSMSDKSVINTERNA